MSVITQERIGAEQARAYLDTMDEPSYPVEPSEVRMFADRMRSGRWTLDGAELVLKDERMIHGRRRMMAVVMSGVEVDFVVVRWPARLEPSAIIWTLRSAESRVGTFTIGEEQFKVVASRSPTSRRFGHDARLTHGYSWSVSILDSEGTRVHEGHHSLTTSPVRDIKSDVAKFVKTRTP